MASGGSELKPETPEIPENLKEFEKDDSIKIEFLSGEWKVDDKEAWMVLKIDEWVKFYSADGKTVLKTEKFTS
jgi:hypothetical protein